MSRDTLVESSTLTAIADAIREKTETSDVMYPSEMAGKIKGISGGIPVPDPIVAGDTIVKQSDKRDLVISGSKVYNYTRSGVGVTMKRAGTYRFIVECSADGSSGDFRVRLYRNGVSVNNFDSSTSIGDSAVDGKITIDASCEAGDFIEAAYRYTATIKRYIYNLTAGITLDALNNDVF